MAESLQYQPLMSMGLLDDGKPNKSSFLISAIVNGSLLLLFMMFGVRQYTIRVQVHHAAEISYNVTISPPPPVLDRVPLLKGPPAKSVLPRMENAPVLTAPSRDPAPKLSSVPITPEIAAPKPPDSTPLTIPKITVVQPPVVKLGSFGSNNVPKPVDSPTVRSATAPVVGSFGAPSAATSNSPHGNTVTNTGFGLAQVATKSPDMRPSVMSAGFSNKIVPPASPSAAKALTATLPPVSTYIPKPKYTPEARAKGIEGEVDVKVIFLETGQIQVLGVVKSLDPGLDKEALSVAQKIKFKPATRNNSPVDFITVIHIQFQLAA